MDLVLGLAMTSRAVRWVLVEGATGEGRPVDRGAISFDDAAEYDPDGLLHGLVDDNEAAGHHLHAIGLTWTNDAAPLAGRIMQSLDERGHVNVFAVSEVEAAGMLATGIAEMTHHDDIAVCLVEPDDAVVAIVTPDDVTADRIERSDALVDDIARLLALVGRPISEIFVLGSAAEDQIVAALAHATPSAVVTATESDLAFARGAGLVAALAVNTVAEAPTSPRLTKVGALASVVGGAVVTLVVATSALIGVHLHPGAVAKDVQAAGVSESAPDAAPVRPAPKAAPKPAPKAPAPKPAPQAPPPAPAPAVVPPEPAYVPPPEPAYVPPAEPAYVPPPAPALPAYVPPPPPAYVPPQVTYPKPRLRDRIIERIPIINRFH